MTVTMSSKHSLDDMTKLATEKLSQIANLKTKIPDLADPEPFPDKKLTKLIRMVPV